MTPAYAGKVQIPRIVTRADPSPTIHPQLGESSLPSAFKSHLITKT
jgi:hypothetical protein